MVKKNPENGKKTDQEILKKIYKMRKNWFDAVIEQLKQRIMANSQKIRRFENRNKHFEENIWGKYCS